MEKQEIQELASALMDAACARGLSEFELETDGFHLRLKRGGAAASAASAAEEAAEAETAAPQAPPIKGTRVEAPLVGIFYSAPSPDEPPFIEVGQKVSKGDTLFIIEAMKTMNEITAPCDGTVSRIFAQNGGVVEYKQLLAVIE